MKKYIKVMIDMQYKPLGPKKEWIRYETENHIFNTVKDAKKFIKDKYGKSKKVKMYRDSKLEKKPAHIGWIYSFKNWTYEDGKKFHFTEQHWVKITDVTEETII